MKKNSNYNNKKIGIIGGVGPQATSFIYETIISLSQKMYGAKNNDDFPHLLVASVPIPDFISDKKNLGVATNMLIDATTSLAAGGATTLCIGSNTVHLLLDTLQSSTPIKFVSMIELVAKECNNRGLQQVGLLGTSVLLDSGMYDQELLRYGITTVLPTSAERMVVDTVIKGVIAGSRNAVEIQKYVEILNGLFDRGAESIILGCTELPLALNYQALGNRTINSDEVLAEGLVKYFYEG